MNRRTKRQITGIVLDNNSDGVSIGNYKYKQFKRCLYDFLVKDVGEEEKIRGYLSYIKDVNSEQYQRLKNIYIKYDKENKLFS